MNQTTTNLYRRKHNLYSCSGILRVSSGFAGRARINRVSTDTVNEFCDTAIKVYTGSLPVKVNASNPTRRQEVPTPLSSPKRRSRGEQ
ncbi:hypothetical protein J2S53_002518 [Actinopolyspora lacussalsi]|nr:hypothetical protein [Actinopolyspora lacussalsi]